MSQMTWIAQAAIAEQRMADRSAEAAAHQVARQSRNGWVRRRHHRARHRGPTVAAARLPGRLPGTAGTQDRPVATY
jgi:hypothetical protein